MGTRRKVAVVGGGISGLGAAYLLRNTAEVTLYEPNHYIGGHSRTLDVRLEDRVIPVDTGFIVFNDRNYPFLNQLFRDLNVPVVKSDMSFGVSIGNGWLEYASNGWKGLFGSPRNLFRPKFWGLIRDILKFNRRAVEYLDAPPSISLGDCLDDLGMGDWFRQYYLLPMGGSIWSCPISQMLRFPASTFIRFFQNHGLLTISDHPQWYTVRGGSRQYVQRILNCLGDRLTIRPGAASIQRSEDSGTVSVRDTSGIADDYDDVIIATHPDEALQLIKNPTDEEQSVLSAFRYQPNEVILHTDASFMPVRKTAWASWIYRSEDKQDQSPAVSLSYWMNNLQELETDWPVIVTLNPTRKPASEYILNRHVFHHPVFNETAIVAQEGIMNIQGQDRLWFCGAYQRNGFHEDGLWSAVRAVRQMGVEIPWS